MKTIEHIYKQNHGGDDNHVETWCGKVVPKHTLLVSIDDIPTRVLEPIEDDQQVCEACWNKILDHLNSA